MAERLQPEVRRARILATAMEITDAQGHRGLTMAALARACGMSTPGLMHYFPDMDTLLAAVVRHRDERDLEMLATAFGRGADDVGEAGLGVAVPRAMVRPVLDAIVDNIVTRPRAAQLFAHVQAQALDPAHPGHAYMRERAQRLASDFADSLGGPAHLPLARALFAAMDGLQLAYLADPDGFDLHAEWALVADALVPPRG